MSLIINNLIAARPERIFAPVSIALEEGSALILRGANGSGKSTLLRTLAGLLPAHSGKITNSHAVLYTGHASGLSPHLNAAEQLFFWAGLAGIKKFSASAILKKAGLEETTARIARLSAGQQRRLALCRLLLEDNKKLWLLDEPQAGLDADGLVFLQKLIAAHLKSGGLAIIALHQGLELENAAVLNLKGTTQ